MESVGDLWKSLGGWVAEGGFRRQNGLRLDKVELDGRESQRPLRLLGAGFSRHFLSTDKIVPYESVNFFQLERVKVRHERVKAPQEGVKGK